MKPADTPIVARRVEPTRSLLQGATYVNAASTDIRARFEAMKQQAQPQQRARRIK